MQIREDANDASWGKSQVWSNFFYQKSCYLLKFININVFWTLKNFWPQIYTEFVL